MATDPRLLPAHHRRPPVPQTVIFIPKPVPANRLNEPLQSLPSNPGKDPASAQLPSAQVVQAEKDITELAQQRAQRAAALKAAKRPRVIMEPTESQKTWDRYWAGLKEKAKLHPGRGRPVEWFYTDDAAKFLGVSRRRVLALIEAGRLVARRHLGFWRMTKKALQAVQDRRPGRPAQKRRRKRINSGHRTR